jgi:hypothetical protein
MRPPEPPRTYDEAREQVIRSVDATLNQFAALPSIKRFNDEAIFCLRLHPDVTAKTYDPSALFQTVPDLENVGSRMYRTPKSSVAQTARVAKQPVKDDENIAARLIFVRSSPTGFRKFIRVLHSSENVLTQKFKTDIRRIERMDLLSDDEQFMGFEDSWKDGRVEIVFHPSNHTAKEQEQLIQRLRAEAQSGQSVLNIAAYENGPTFVSCVLNFEMRDAFKGVNPLRSIHPLDFGGFDEIRSAPDFKAPRAPSDTARSTVKVGMFDGGINVNHPLLKNFVEQDENHSIKTTAIPSYVAHGTAVAGIMLYGPLNDADPNVNLPCPPVSVVSFRALPTSDPSDIDLYESIDVIESAVPARPDIHTYNLSFGPSGPILDDDISRFTFVLDRLAVTYNVGFYIAVGNDGEATVSGMDRIQSPSDMANGIGVGAYTRRNGIVLHAPYSCKGAGRECAKIKPDIVALGGCRQNPIHLLSSDDNVGMGFGTSYASPAGASLSAQITGSVERCTPLLARAMLVHTAIHPDGVPDHKFGHGYMCENLDAIVRCPDTNDVTIIYISDITPTKLVKLPILLPPELTIPGKVRMTWTIACLPQVDSNHPSEYTTCCIEDTFYPNSQSFKFTKKVESQKPINRVLHMERDSEEIRILLTEGWKQSELPVSNSGNQYRSELEQRAVDCKWEPMIRRQITKNSKSLHSPFIVLHAVPRNSANYLLKFAAVVTIHAPKYEEDLYTKIRKRYPALAPISVRTENELRIKLN